MYQTKNKINNVKITPDSDCESSSSNSFNIIQHEPEDTHYCQSEYDSDVNCHATISVVNAEIGNELCINAIHGESDLPQKWDESMEVGHVSDSKLLTNKPETGMCYTLRRTIYTKVLSQDKAFKKLLDIGAFCSCASSKFLDIIYPEWRQNLLPVPKATFSSCNSTIYFSSSGEDWCSLRLGDWNPLGSFPS